MSTTDPLQALIEAGAIPATSFTVASRYSGVPLGLYRAAANAPGVPYVLRRFIPQARDIATAGLHRVQAGERPDRLAFQSYGDPELYWRIADANGVIDPFELTDELGARVVIPVAPGT